MNIWQNSSGDQYDKSFLDKLEEVKQAVMGHTEAIKQIGLDKLLPDKKAENVVIDARGYTLDSAGYPYMGIFVSAAKNLTVSYIGTSYTLSLSAGFNQLILPNEALLTPATDGQQITGILIRSTTTFQ